MPKKSKSSSKPVKFATERPPRASQEDIEAVYNKLTEISDELYGDAPPLTADEIQSVLNDTTNRLHRLSPRYR